MSKFKEERDAAAEKYHLDTVSNKPVPDTIFMDNFLGSFEITEKRPYIAETKAFQGGWDACLESSVVKNAIAALECNETFHSLGGIGDCEPCKAKRDYEQALAEIRGEK